MTRVDVKDCQAAQLTDDRIVHGNEAFAVSIEQDEIFVVRIGTVAEPRTQPVELRFREPGVVDAHTAALMLLPVTH